MNKNITIILLIAMLLIGAGAASVFLGPPLKQLRQHNKQLKKEIEAQRKVIHEQRKLYNEKIDSIETESIKKIQEAIKGKENKVVYIEKRTNEKIDSLINLSDSLHILFLTREYGIDFD